MGSPSPICKRVATALSQGEVALLPSDGLYMALVSAAHCEQRDKLDALCGAAATHGPETRLFAFVEDAHALSAWELPLPEAAAPVVEAFWPGPLSIVQAPSAKTALPKAFAGQTLELCCAQQSFLREVLAALHEMQDSVSPPMLIGIPSHRPGQLPVTSGRWLPQSLGEEKIADLLEQVPFIIDAGPTRNGCLPTAIAVNKDGLTLLREGPVSQQELADKFDGNITQALETFTSSFGDLELIPEVPKAPKKGLQPVQELAQDAWTIGVGPRPKNCPNDRWIELYEEPEAFIAEYFDALAQASDAGAKTVYLRVPNDALYTRLGLAQ